MGRFREHRPLCSVQRLGIILAASTVSEHRGRGCSTRGVLQLLFFCCRLPACNNRGCCLLCLGRLRVLLLPHLRDFPRQLELLGLPNYASLKSEMIPGLPSQVREFRGTLTPPGSPPPSPMQDEPWPVLAVDSTAESATSLFP